MSNSTVNIDIPKTLIPIIAACDRALRKNPHLMQQINDRIEKMNGDFDALDEVILGLTCIGTGMCCLYYDAQKLSVAEIANAN